MGRLRVRGGAVLTLDAAGTVYDFGEVVAEAGRVVYAGPADALPPAPDDDVVDADGGLVLPGLVNAHCHSSDSLVAGTAPALPLEAWSLYTEAGRFGRTPRDVYLSAALAAMDAAKSGTTTLLDHIRLSPALTPDGLDAAAQAFLDVGVRPVIAPVVSDLAPAETMPLDLIDLPSELAASLRRPGVPWREQLDVCEAFLVKWQGRVTVQIGPSAPQRCSDVLLDACGAFAQRYGARLHMHFLETAAQAVVAGRRFSGGTARAFGDRGLLANSSLVHCVHVDDDDVGAIVASGAVVVHLPHANLRLASGTMPWGAFASRGVPIALGTDGVLCNDSLSMFSVMKTAGLLHAGQPGTDAIDLLRAATQQGARACGVDGIGALTPGARADFVVLAPAVSRDPLDRAVYGEESRPPRVVVVDGQVVVRDGRLTRVDEDGLIAEAREAAEALVRRNASRFEHAGAMAAPMLRLVGRAKEVLASTRSGKGHSGSFN